MGKRPFLEITFGSQSPSKQRVTSKTVWLLACLDISAGILG
jgi:hypothetical protein